MIGSVMKIWMVLLIAAVAVCAQKPASGQRTQETSEFEGVPVLVKHLPQWETKRASAIFMTRKAELLTFLDNRPVFEAIEFMPGTEAVIASYPAGKLLIVEFTTPQASALTDQRVTEYIRGSGPDGSLFYRRIGNYNVFLFDGEDEAAANELFSQIKYEKVVQWLGRDPNVLFRAERAFILDATSLFLSTMLVIITGLGASVLLGIVGGFAFFLFREHQRAEMTDFSDAGGMVRLNLDGIASGFSGTDRRRVS